MSEFYLINEDEDEVVTSFDTEDELEEFLKDNDYTEDDVEDLKVLEVNKEYRVVLDQEFSLEEID